MVTGRRPASLRLRALRSIGRRPGALLAAATVAAVTLLAFIAPLLPIERPELTRTRLAYEPPSLASQARGDPPGSAGFWLHGWERVAKRPAGDLPWDGSLEAARERLFGDRSLPALMGRDALGRCLLARICWGTRVSLATAAAAALVSIFLGVLYGAVAGYAGGRLDNLMMRVVDMLYSIPFIFVVIFLITVLRPSGAAHAGGGGSNLGIFFVVIGLVYWLTMARVVRGQVVSLREQEFIEGARALGASTAGIIRRHILPNLTSVVIVTITLTIPRILLFEAFLSFLGLGVEAPMVSWGILAREAFEVLNPVRTAWWMVLWPSLFMVATLASLNHLGDALRDAFDPRQAR